MCLPCSISRPHLLCTTIRRFRQTQWHQHRQQRPLAHHGLMNCLDLISTNKSIRVETNKNTRVGVNKSTTVETNKNTRTEITKSKSSKLRTGQTRACFIPIQANLV